MTTLAGVVSLKMGELRTNIEIVRSVSGVRAGDIETTAISAEFAGQKIRVLDPISLLYCKMELALTVAQEGRRDVDHLQMLIFCVRAFLREALRETEREAALQKGWLGAAEKVLSLAESGKGAKAARRWGIHWRMIFPEKEIMQSKLPKVVLFRERRLPEWKSKMASPRFAPKE